MPLKLKFQLAAVLAAAAVLLAGCQTASGPEPTPQTSTISPPALNSLEEFYGQSLNWRGCQERFECADAVAPLDWAEPSAGTIVIAMMRLRTEAPIGSLLINPGGPGSSGIDWMLNSPDSIATPEIRKAFDIVAFDPRGVGASSAIICPDEGLKDELLYGQSPFEYGSPADFQRTKDLLSEFSADCQAGSGDLLLHVDTQAAARDLDLMRELLGEASLNYLGYSYGTQLGATYAALFPDRVGRFVLDGAIDPRVPAEQQLINQAAGFDKAFRAYLADCLQGSDCPFSGTVDESIAKVSQFFEDRESTVLETQINRPLTLSASITGVIAALYAKESWPYLSLAFDEAFDDDGTTLLLFADLYNDRAQDSGYSSNLIEANIAINCRDGRYSQDEAVIAETNAKLLAASKSFGKYFQDPQLSCYDWPEGKPLATLDYGVPLATGPLVIGTTGDPATPYQQAVELAQLLSDAILLTYQGEGHTVYGGDNGCVNQIVDKYLTTGELPAIDQTCS